MLWDMSPNDWLISFAFLACFTYITGWFVDRILTDTGFGHVGNWLVILSGTYAGLFAVNLYGYELQWYPLFTLIATGAAAFMMLFILCFAKKTLGT